MYLIADSGGTSTNWLVANRESPLFDFESAGLNPNTTKPDAMERILREQVKPLIEKQEIEYVFFYGAGLSAPERQTLIKSLILRELGEKNQVFINTDLMAAACATLQGQAGIVAILGTGSVVFRYNGQKIYRRCGGWGPMLGDEGGGIALGRAWVRAYLDDDLPKNLVAEYYDFIQLKKQEIVHTIYHDQGNKFLARQTYFLSSHYEDPWVKQWLVRQFIPFFDGPLKQCLENSNAPVVFTGSIAAHFFGVLSQIAQEHGFPPIRLFSPPLVHALFRYITLLEES